MFIARVFNFEVENVLENFASPFRLLSSEKTQWMEVTSNILQVFSMAFVIAVLLVKETMEARVCY